MEITAEILTAARRHLASEGAPSLSLRAIARELGMTSSAIYRYVASRDDLLTWLIVDAYNSLGAACEFAEAEVEREDLFGRFRATCEAVRAVGDRNPHEWALIYGSPVPGYVAPGGHHRSGQSRAAVARRHTGRRGARRARARVVDGRTSRPDA